MPNFVWSQRSKNNLSGVHPDLRAVCDRALEITTQDMIVIEGVRNIERQKQLVAKGFSTTMNSRHLTGHAVDITPYPVSWEWDDYEPLEKAMKQAAEELGVEIEWGGDWKSFKDAPHWQLSWEAYPNA